MKTVKTNPELLKEWDTEDLVAALASATAYSIEPIIGSQKMWAERAKAYGTELATRGFDIETFDRNAKFLKELTATNKRQN